MVKITKTITLLTLVGVILISGFLVIETYDIEYSKLSYSISYGRTPYLLPKILSSLSVVIMFALGGILLLHRQLGNNLFFNVILLLISNMMMFAVISFLSQGYVVGDQPRAEFALGTLVIEGKLSLEDAEYLSEYFRWPGLWIYEGIFSSITGISSFEAPVLLMIIVWFTFGIFLTIMLRHIYGVKNFSSAIIAFSIYTILNPYKIIHLCPQIYALMLFTIIIVLSFKRQATLSNSIVVLLLAVAIIISHPLTSVVAVAVLLIRDFTIRLTKNSSQSITLREGLVFSVLVFFITWNIRFEDLIRSIVSELTGGVRLQTLEPIASRGLYSTDFFYEVMSFYRYGGLFLMFLFALLTLFLHRSNRIFREVFYLVVVISIGSLLLNFIPGSFFHRVLYYLAPFIAVLSAGSFDVQKLIIIVRKIPIKALSISVMIILPLLAQLSITEFLTNNNPLATLNSPFEFSLGKFVGDFYIYSGTSWSISSGTINYYLVLSQKKILSSYILSSSTVLRVTYLATYLKEGNLSAVNLYIETVYPAHFFVVSPREKYIFYERTNFENFHIIDFYLNDNYYSKIYDNKLFRLYKRYT